MKTFLHVICAWFSMGHIVGACVVLLTANALSCLQVVAWSARRGADALEDIADSLDDDDDDDDSDEIPTPSPEELDRMLRR